MIAAATLILLSGWASQAAGLVGRWSDWAQFPAVNAVNAVNADRLMMVVAVILL